LIDRLTYIFAADSTGIYSLLFTKLSLKFEPSASETAGTKTEFDIKLQDQVTSFKVIYFAINYRPTRGSISSYNRPNAGRRPISKVSEEVSLDLL